MRALIVASCLALFGSAHPASAQQCFVPLPWTEQAYLGSAGTYFGDIDGDGHADAVALNLSGANGIGTMANTIGVRHAYYVSSQQPAFPWSEQVLGNTTGINAISLYPIPPFIVDVNADGRDDLVVFDTTQIRVRINSTTLPWPDATVWSGKTGITGPFVTAFMADVDNDHRADIVVIREHDIRVRRSTGSSFLPEQIWLETSDSLTASSTAIADVTGDGRADAIFIRFDGIYVRRSTGAGFSRTLERWTQAPFAGTYGTYFADVTGDGRADAIAISSTAIIVAPADVERFAPNELWLSTAPFHGTFLAFALDTRFAHVTNTTKADLVMMMADGTIHGRPSDGSSFLYEPFTECM